MRRPMARASQAALAGQHVEQRAGNVAWLYCAGARVI
jgi:hypothetical protein